MSNARIGRGLACLAGAAVLVAATPGIGHAYWPATDAAHSARATADTLPSGNTPSVSLATNNATLTFARPSTSASSGAITLTSYTINRYAAGAPTPSASFSCTSSAGANATCTESTVPDGNWEYTDTPRLSNWVGVESARSSVATIDTTGPAVTISSPANGGATNVITPTISGTAGVATGDLTGITIKIYSGPTTAGTLLQTKSSTASAGSWSVAASALTANATYTAQATQSDSSGNVGTTTSTFVVDTTAPLTVTLTSPAASSTVGPTPTFAGAASALAASSTTSADSTTVTVNIYAGGTATGTPVQSPTASVVSGSYSTVSSPLASGQYTARTTQTDGAGNSTNSNTRTFTVDATAPAVTITSQSTGATNNVTPTFSGAAGNLSGDSNTVTVKVYAGSAATGSPIQTFTPNRSGASWSVTATTLTANAQYTVQATQSDSFGNVGTATRTFVVDTVKPTNVTVTAPAAGSTNPATPIITGTAGTVTASTTGSADDTTVTVTVYQGNGTGGNVVQTLTANVVGGNYTVTAAALSSGTYTVQATQSDAAGNQSLGSNTRTFTVDATAPVVTVTSPSNNSFTNDATPALSGAAGNLTGDQSTITVHVYAGSSTAGALVQTLTPTKSGSSWSATPTTALANGQYTVQASQSDAAGNVGFSNTRTFTVDTTAPVLTMALSNGGSTSKVTASGTAGIGDGTVTVYFCKSSSCNSANADQTKSANPDGAGNWTVTSANNGNGTWYARAEQTDAAGNLGFVTAGPFVR